MKVIKYDGNSFRNLMNSGQYKKVLLSVHHGLGDAILFYYNVLPVLKANYPNVEFYFDTWKGQQDFFGQVDKDYNHYDLVVEVLLPTAEWDKRMTETKAERSLRIQFGFPNEKQCELYTKDTEPQKLYPSPLVGVHFFSVSCQRICYGKEDAEKIWNAIKERDLIPIDTQLNHPEMVVGRQLVVHKPFQFEDRNLNGVQPNLKNLFGIMGTLRGFAGVSSGNFLVALCTLPPEKILYIGNQFPGEKITRLPIHKMMGYDQKVVNQWLDDLMK